MPFLRPAIVLSILGALALAACGGGSDSGRPDLRKVPTATPYATLPAPTIVTGEGLVPSGAAGEGTYVVESGDSLSLIAEKLGVSMEDLIRLNELADPSRLEVGQVLKVPAAPGAPPSTPAPGATPRPATTPRATGDFEAYVVESGDNASDIAGRFGVTLQELADANNTTIDGLRDLEVGQELLIPPPSSSPVPEATEAPPEEAPPVEEPPVEEPPTEEPPPEVPPEGLPLETPTPEV